jgi:hypothetical protein
MRRPATKWHTFPDLYQHLSGGHYGAHYKKDIFSANFFWVLVLLRTQSDQLQQATKHHARRLVPSPPPPHAARIANDKGAQGHLSDGVSETTGNSRE